MQQWVGFFRGINVGGHNRLPMQDLVEVLAGAGCVDVATYIQSGNVVFSHSESDAKKLSVRITRRVDEGFGFAPAIHLLTLADLQDCVTRNPFREAEQDHKTLHLSFLSEPAANADITALEALKAAGEQFRLAENVFYLFAPDGIGRSKLAANAEKLLGVTTTSRNWRTVCKVLEMAGNE